MGDTYKKKLIEVAIPIDEINAACKADKDRKTGTVRNLHKWFAPAPLPAWRALLFAALIDDPEDDEKRAYLLNVIKRLVQNGADLPDEDNLQEAQALIQAQFPDGVPTVMDPFCGGGSTLVEAQRLGLPTFGSDLNPVPVLITRTLTELLPKVYKQQPLHPECEPLYGDNAVKTYDGYDGLIREVTYYAELIRDRAWEKLKDWYPSQPDEKPIAWLWARTAICPNPACGIETILTTSWWLSKRKNDLAWIEPRVADGHVELEVAVHQPNGAAPPTPKIGDGVFACIACAATLDGDYLREEGKEGRLGSRMTAVVSERAGFRQYRQPTQEDAPVGAYPDLDASPIGSVPLNVKGQGIRVGLYGIDTWDKLYTPRQLQTLGTFADLVGEVYQEILDEGGAQEWAVAVSTILGLAVGKLAQYLSSQARIEHGHGGSNRTHPAFARNDLPMTWDFAEVFPLGDRSANWGQFVSTTLRALGQAPAGEGTTRRSAAQNIEMGSPGLVATDPPYFDAIGYADLSDFFYLWHRRALKHVHPDLYATVAAPKSGELTAIPSHHDGSKEKARHYFIEGFTETFRNLQRSMRNDLPMLVVYASKEQSSGAGEETRWESILSAMLAANIEITGAWPIHMTSTTRLVGLGTNAVAAYIVMVCRARPSDAGTVSLMEFTRELRRELPSAVLNLQEASVLPVDLPQAVLGPGMSLFSQHKAVLDQSGEPITVGRAMSVITTALDEILDEQQGELDPASRFAAAWWESFCWDAGPFGTADKIIRPYGITVDDLVIAGVAESRGGNVRLLGSGDLDREWRPSRDAHPTAWEAVHHLADRLIDGGGVQDAAELLAQLGVLKDQAQMLAYRLESIAARKGWAKDQERYNALIGSWSDMLAAAASSTGAVEGLF